MELTLERIGLEPWKSFRLLEWTDNVADVVLEPNEPGMQDPPLSEVKTMIVSLVTPSSSKAVITLPTFASRFSIMAA